MTELYLDLETFCERPLSGPNTVGAFQYAEAAEVLLLAWAEDTAGVEGKVTVEDLTDDEGIGRLQPSNEFYDALSRADKIIIHNAMFDRTVIRYSKQFPVKLPAERVECTMIRAMESGLPGGLGVLSDILRLTEGKDTEGRRYINLFCKPAPKNQTIRRRTKVTNPDDWTNFIGYAGQDIRAMRELRKRLAPINYPMVPKRSLPGARQEERLFHLDAKINARGFYIDTDLAEAAVAMTGVVDAQLKRRLRDRTDDEVQTANQRDKLLAHLLKAYDVDLPDLQKGTLERRVNDPELPAPVRELLALRLEAATTSTKKYDALLRSVSPDGRLRGTLQFCGAARTTRWAGRLFQPQNLPRPTHAEALAVEGWIDDIKSGVGDMLLADPNRAAAVALRGAIIAPEGKKLLAADLSNIEGRMLAWLAGETWKLKAFAAYDRGDGPDLYKVGAGLILNKTPGEVDDDERQTFGKVPELACGYQGAEGAFRTMMALYGMDLDGDTIRGIVNGWRERNSNIRDLWYKTEQAAMDAVRNPGSVYAAGRLRFKALGSWLLILLPSGRALVYMHPKIVPHPKFDSREALSFVGLNGYTRKWGRQYTYGGKLVENATQKIARDVLGDAMLRIENAGYPIVLSVHDEVICETPDTDRFTVAELTDMLSKRPSWADENLPLSASGFEAYRYRK